MREGRRYEKLADELKCCQADRSKGDAVTDTRFVCSVCGTVFSDHRASVREMEEDQIGCPNCGSARLEPYDFDPDGPVIDPLAGPDEEDHAT